MEGYGHRSCIAVTHFSRKLSSYNPSFAKQSSQQVDLLNMAINSHIENRLLTRIVCAKPVDADDLKLFQQYERAEWDAFAPELAKKCKSTTTGSEHRMVPTVAGVNL